MISFVLFGFAWASFSLASLYTFSFVFALLVKVFSCLVLFLLFLAGILLVRVVLFRLVVRCPFHKVLCF